jgi:hypothetical protein
LISELAQQKANLLAGNPSIQLVKPCRIDDGILKIHPSNEAALINSFERQKDSLAITFFVPASGSGSRMFDHLYDFLKSDGNLKPDTYEAIEKLLNRSKDFALFNLLPRHYKIALKDGTVNVKELVQYLLADDGLGLGQLPKGLIPFHRYGKFIINPFQEHIVQGAKIGGDNADFHFTINRHFEAKIKRNLDILKDITGIDFNFSFSEQDVATHAYTFNKNNEPITDKTGSYLMRPAGHGALLSNLNSIDADLIFIKNIDNIQHYTKAHESIKTKKMLGAKLLEFRENIQKILKALDENSDDFLALANEINTKFQLQIDSKHIEDKEFLYNYFNRPMRICGMVLNEGQIGGGPFWVKDSTGSISKQIIEKSQIGPKETIDSSFLRATHFNPVEIICSVKDYKGRKFDLHKYSNSEQYFLVSKKHKGKQIKYIEKPGLWNGGMFNWLTLFYEISGKCFSPVKSFTDLLNPLHLENNK